MPWASDVAGQGKLSPERLGRIEDLAPLVYLHFPLDVLDQRERILKYTQIVQRLGGLGVKLESSGNAHPWERWFALLSSTPYDIYNAVIVLVADTDDYYSCGMHHFGLPECETPRALDIGEAADLMNQFNFWQISERPELSSTGHTFSVTATAPRFRLSRHQDTRHDGESLFHNPNGTWRLDS